MVFFCFLSRAMAEGAFGRRKAGPSFCSLRNKIRKLLRILYRDVCIQRRLRRDNFNGAIGTADLATSAASVWGNQIASPHQEARRIRKTIAPTTIDPNHQMQCDHCIICYTAGESCQSNAKTQGDFPALPLQAWMVRSGSSYTFKFLNLAQNMKLMTKRSNACFVKKLIVIL